MNYIAHFQQFIKLYKTPLNPKNGLPSTTLKMPLQIPVGAFLYQNVPTLCLLVHSAWGAFLLIH